MIFISSITSNISNVFQNCFHVFSSLEGLMLYNAVCLLGTCWGAWALNGRYKMRCAWAKRLAGWDCGSWEIPDSLLSSKHTIDFCVFGWRSFHWATSKSCIPSRQPRLKDNSKKGQVLRVDVGPIPSPGLPFCFRHCDWNETTNWIGSWFPPWDHGTLKLFKCLRGEVRFSKVEPHIKETCHQMVAWNSEGTVLSGNKKLARLRQSKEDENRSGSSLQLRLCRRVIPALSCLDELFNTKTVKPGLHFSAKPAGIDIQHFIAWKRGGILASHPLHIPELFLTGWSSVPKLDMREQNSRAFISTAKASCLYTIDGILSAHTHTNTDAITCSCKCVCVHLSCIYIMQMHTDRRCWCSLCTATSMFQARRNSVSWFPRQQISACGPTQICRIWYGWQEVGGVASRGCKSDLCTFATGPRSMVSFGWQIFFCRKDANCCVFLSSTLLNNSFLWQNHNRFLT